MNLKLSIVIVTWNTKQSLERLLVSIEKFADVSCEVFVIDNNSQDSTRQFLSQFQFHNQFVEKFELICNEKNVGYSSAANRGMEKAQGEYVLLLNPDTLLLAPSFVTMIEIAQKLPNLGALGFKIILPSGKIQCSISHLPTLTKIISSRLLHYKPVVDYEREQEVEQINASVTLMPRIVLQTIGLWDGGFFIWFEENDFCIRARRAGFKIYYSPKVSLLHESQTGISQIPLMRRLIIWEQSLFRYYYKHHGICIAIIAGILDPLCMAIGMIYSKIKKALRV